MRVAHLAVRCSRTGRELSIPVDRIAALEPTRATCDVLLLGGERLPVAGDLAALEARLAALRAAEERTR